jgi:hypothetical protein
MVGGQTVIFAEGFGVAEVGLTAFCLLLVIFKLLDFFKNNKKNGTEEALATKIDQLITKLNATIEDTKVFRRDFYNQYSQIKDLHDWHNKDDGDGRKIWYFKQSFEESIKENTETQKQNNVLLANLDRTIKDLDN